MKSKILHIFYCFVLVAFVVSCAAPTPPPPTVREIVTEEFKMLYNDAAEFYASYAALDAKESEYVAQYANLFQRLKDQTKDDYFIVQACFQNSEDFVVALATAAYGSEGLGGQDEQSYLSLLQVGQTLPPGISIEECQRAATSMIVFSRSVREEGFNIKNQILSIRRQRSELESGTINSAVVFEFYQKYGADLKYLIQTGDQKFAEFIGSKSESQKLPADFVGFPTKLLMATTQNPTIGEYYLAIAEGKALPPEGKYQHNYSVSFDPATGVYTLYKAAAEGYITLLITPSRGVQETLEEGCTSTFSDCSDSSIP